MGDWLRHLLGEEDVEDTDISVLTSAFMEMDAALSRVQAAVADYRVVTGHDDLDRDWELVRQHVDPAVTTYLDLTATDDDGTSPRLSPQVLKQGVDMMCAATDEIVAYKTQHEHALSVAAGKVLTIISAAESARSLSVKAYDELNNLEPQMKSYAAVRAAQNELDAAVGRLDSAWSQRAYLNLERAAIHAHEAATVLMRIAQDAPNSDQRAASALTSVSTRISAARNRIKSVEPILSALLREFPASSSTDLIGNAVEAREIISMAFGGLGQARAAHSNGDPEGALAWIDLVRESLAKSDELTDAVISRLRVLHEIRDDPKKRADQIRFRLRDAQMLAQQSEAKCEEWRNPLKAQLARIEKLEASLNTTHPDYWGYAVGLERVGEFIASAVRQMRQQ